MAVSKKAAPAKKPEKPAAKSDEKWMQGVHPEEGAYRAQTGTPEGKNIPLKTEQADAKKPGLIGKRARLALSYRKASKK